MPKPVSTQGISEDEVAACNNAVKAIVEKQEGKKQRKQYHSYTSQQRASIGRYATQHGPTATSQHLAKLLGHSVPEATVRKFRDLYRKELESSRKQRAESIPIVSELPPKKRVRPLLLGDLDSPVQDYIRMLHLFGGVVNARLVVAAARGLIIAINRFLIADYGAHLNPDKTWAKSLLRYVGFIKRKATTSARVAVQDFKAIKEGFLERVVTVVKTHSIPQSLIIKS